MRSPLESAARKCVDEVGFGGVSPSRIKCGVGQRLSILCLRGEVQLEWVSSSVIPSPHDEESAVLAENDRYAAMIDGRAIHFFFQLVEPVLIALHPGMRVRTAREPSGASYDGTYSPVLRVQDELRNLQARGEIDALPWVSLLRRSPHIYIDVRQLKDGGGDFDSIAAAVEILDAIRLAFFLDLSVGCIIHGRRDGWIAPACIGISAELSVEATAIRLLAGSADAFFRLWVEAEGAASGIDPFQSEAAAAAGSFFAIGVIHEAARRLPALAQVTGEQRATNAQNALFTDPSLAPADMETLKSFPLCNELLACWHPTRRRSRPIFCSRFNTMRMLGTSSVDSRRHVHNQSG